jgi:polyhydroxyalkanoate synthesis regulator phasin
MEGMIYMMKYLEKTLYFGLGLITYSAEKVEHLVDELVKKGEVASEDAKKLINELIEKGENQKEAIRKFIREEMTKHSAQKTGPVAEDVIRQIVREELERIKNQEDTEE